ncbi:TlpA disulfide reductase family protein [Acetobacter estunensis]|uniref:TlpA disulfide reductase family protein n=1 Tax=Acetobacter estunensis TaxID=104097 RepID=UPI001C2D042E|nr:TlpA disulfide reductase family protein [Acetobacter estunensis]MBV1836302.1 TlpA family protein disulfide reductase [Acetobacter estunensis]
MPRHHPGRREPVTKLRRRCVLVMGGTLIAGLAPRKRLHAADVMSDPLPPSSLQRGTPQPLPTLSVTDADGMEHELADWRGRPTIVHLWATWCVPCVKELPELAHARTALEAAGLVVVPVAIDHRGPEVVQPFLEKLGLAAFSTFFDERRAIMGTLEEEGLPTTLFLNPQGLLVTIHAGSILWSAPDAAVSLQHLLT